VSGELAAAALRYAAAGWPVFPVAADSKKPPLTAHGFKDASADPARIRAWWARWPGANIGIATGAPGPDVLDVDMREAGSGYPAYNQLLRAGLLSGGQAAVRTPSGGLHAYFPGTCQPCGSLPARFLDFKAAGGYVIGPPSRVGGHPYELLDHRPGTARLDWQAVKRLLGPPRPVPPRTAAWGGGELPPSVQRALAADAADRSAALHRLVGACARAGLDETAIHQITGSYQPALEKYGNRLPAEVERSLRKIGAGA
jgi:Bifunctional DNA primase/polymerase, N-terminal